MSCAITYIKDYVLDVEVCLILQPMKVDIDDVICVVKVTKVEKNKVIALL